MITKYKLVLFDAGGTLLHPYPSVGNIYSKVAAKYGCEIGEDELNERFKVVWKKHDGLDSLVSHSNEKIEKEWWRGIVLDVFSHRDGFDQFEPFFEELYDLFAKPECWRLYPEVTEVLETLKKRNQPMGIVSNWDSRLLRLCEEFDLVSYFDFILASAVFGASKPNPKIFEEAIQRSNVAPHEVVHIGDSIADDIKGGRGAGIDVVHLDRHDHGEKHAFLEEHNIPSIQHLGELL